MQRTDRWPDDYDPDTPKSRSGSRRNSASLSRRSSVKKEKEGKKKSPLTSTPNSSNSTPKKVVKPQNLEFLVTGKQLLKRSERASSLPGYQRRPSAESISSKTKRKESPKRATNSSQSSKSRETSLEDDMTLDLSQVSDFEDTNSKYGVKQKFTALATSTPKSIPKNFQKPRSASMQSQLHSQRMESSRRNQKMDISRQETFSCSRDSLFKSTSSASNYRYAASTDLDYSSVSPEYSQSSAELSPRDAQAGQLDALTPRSQELQVSSCCVSTWQECSEATQLPGEGEECARSAAGGEWSAFWANYNNSVAKVPVKSYYDQCPTPYRTENIDLADLELSADGSRKRSPEDLHNLNNIIRHEGLHLTPRETQNMIKCAHILGNVLTRAIERRSKEKDDKLHKLEELQKKSDAEVELKKKTLTLPLKETIIPIEVKEEKTCETVTTQTDISLPNTKSAPRIFEKILRQLSRTSLEEGLEKMLENKEKEKEDALEKNN